MDERKPWEQDIEHGEPDLWYGRFVKYLRLGTKRSVNAVSHKEHKKGQEKSRTNAGPEWYEAAKLWNWEERARKYDKWQLAEEDRIIAEEREKVIRSGFALQHKRIKELDRLSRQLIAFTKEEKKIWMPETRTIGNGDNAQTIEKETFNHQVYALIDKYFDSIAKEMGERVKQTELSGKVDSEHVEKIMFYMPVVDDDDTEQEGGDANANNSHSQGSEDQAEH